MNIFEPVSLLPLTSDWASRFQAGEIFEGEEGGS